MPKEPVIPVGKRVRLIQSGWVGTVVKHAEPAVEDRPFVEVSYWVEWDKNGHIGFVRSLKRLEILP